MIFRKCSCGKVHSNNRFNICCENFSFDKDDEEVSLKRVATSHKMESMTDIAKKLGITIEEDILTEAKGDQQKFIDTFGQDVFDTFRKNAQRLRNKGINTDITWHVKHTSPTAMRKIISQISDEQRAKEVDIEGVKLPEPTGNYEVVFENDEYIVYHPMDYISSIYCAKGGRWCTAGGYMIPEGKVKVSQAKQYFNQYHDKGVELYYFIRDNGERYALAVYPDGVSYEVFNKADENIGDIENIPGIEDIEIDGLDIEGMIGNGGMHCVHCGESLIEDNTYYSPDGEPMCEYCFGLECTICETCGDAVWNDDAVNVNTDKYDIYVCVDCADSYYYQCKDCGEYFESGVVISVGDDWFCEYCVSEHPYEVCSNCGEVFLNDGNSDGSYGPDDEWYCNDCFDDKFTQCDICGAIYDDSEMNYHEGQCICDGCFDEYVEEEEDEED